jgi:cyclophilin family peptidyl-prolyl cis-trans isomerase
MARRLLALGLVALAAAGCGGSKKADTTTAAAVDANGCTPVAQPPPTQRSEGKPTTKLDPSRHYDVTFHTNCGSFTVRLAVKTSPKTTASFANLVQKQFFDHTLFHRIAPGFVIQGGDPLGTGGGGPGYHVDEAPPANLAYTKGTVAMAKTEVDPPGRSGSQFYVVTAADAGLPPEYALVGKVSKGYDVVEKIEALGDPNTSEGPPTQPVLIEKMTIEKG